MQGNDKPDCAYLTKWTSMHNSCEGVREHQAIDFFTNGCRDDTMLKHKLSRADPQTMAQVMAIADKYATADAAMKKPTMVDD